MCGMCYVGIVLEVADGRVCLMKGVVWSFRRVGVMEAHKLKYSNSQMISTREVEGRAQICKKLNMPENLSENDWIWISDVVGKVWVELEQFKKSVGDRWSELAGTTAHVWLSSDQFDRIVRWKFHSIVKPNGCDIDLKKPRSVDYNQLISKISNAFQAEADDLENIERFADLAIL
ncbi:unnamed protein product [Litomosoides sigmodontis]|uniref:Uncharacterized protein n=1 Tax=Litomosoides sigmodontis TaxID=42156 RepID=A0A3P6TXY6_LITSI|nr:unnamed protein product [Litomosoides sigmodontis]